MADRESDEELFTFSWLALKLLGKNLYSNPWSALSELVANGLDAGADRVLVYVDVRTKDAASIDVFDNGRGMSRADIQTYVRVGYNKRDDPERAEDGGRAPMGRKGIGKLAALYLSPHFYLRTKREGDDTAWHLDARDGAIRDDDRPALRAVGQIPPSANLLLWEAFPSGTFISLRDVDLRGYGSESVAALGARLANQFVLESESESESEKPTEVAPAPGEDDRTVGPVIELFVHSAANAGDPLEFSVVRKQVAFKNFAFVMTRFAGQHPAPAEILEAPAHVKIPAPDLKGGFYSHLPETGTFEQRPDTKDKEIADLGERLDLDATTIDGLAFSLEGWIGLHATIEVDAAKENDDRFRKNKFYNPAQLRVYVRGKLASDRLLGQLGITGTYANYIEGEISFDVLDADGLADIATSNRQDFDETDERVTLLRALVRPVVRALIQKRNALAEQITALSKEERSRRETAGKAVLVEQFGKDLEGYPELTPESRGELQLIVANKVKGDVVAKEDFKVFISHASADRGFASFIYELLLSRGVRAAEVFYTSRVGDTAQYEDARALGVVIRDNILAANTLLFYLTSKNFGTSEFCLFEAGAGWATRAVNEYLKLNVEYAAVPAFLSNSRVEFQLLDGGTITLTPAVHNYLIERVLNPMIEHLNQGRKIAEEDEIELFEKVAFPTVVELRRAKKVLSDYFDSSIVEHWDAHIEPNMSEYLDAYFGSGSSPTETNAPTRRRGPKRRGGRRRR